MDLHIWIQSIVLLVCLIAVLAKDYYEILEVKRDASEKEIKRKFRKLGRSIQLGLSDLHLSLRSIEISSG